MIKTLGIAISCLLIGYIAGQKYGGDNITQIDSDSLKLKKLSTISKSERGTRVTFQECNAPKSEIKENKDKGVAKVNSKYTRTEDSLTNITMSDLAYDLREAIQSQSIEEQNEIFSKMEKLDPIHQEVYRAKVEFLQNDNKWDEAHSVLKDCIRDLPKSAHCYRRLTNIRSSSLDDKIKYGERCLEISKNDTVCTVDLAIAYRESRQYQKAARLFERALMISRQEGFDKDYILFQQAINFELMSQIDLAKAAYKESCSMNFKESCEEYKRLE